MCTVQSDFMAPNPMIRWLRSRIRALVAFALIPVALLSGQPVHGCICADGHYEFFCRAGHRASRHQEETDTASTIAESCSCCHKADAGKTSHDCCKGATGCCDSAKRQSQDPQHPASPYLSGKGCCTPVVSDATERTLTASVQTNGDHQVVALFAIMPELPCSQMDANRCPHLLASTGPPPDDLVVTLQRLVI